ncbi:hypothetical protein [Streptomyces sp. 8N616]|uniref:hypothetical protein n=1 Tax=Streptomyces sp. 8N616 TaxID=3457414 RepID=UPI003FD2877D
MVQFFGADVVRARAHGDQVGDVLAGEGDDELLRLGVFAPELRGQRSAQAFFFVGVDRQQSDVVLEFEQMSACGSDDQQGAVRPEDAVELPTVAGCEDIEQEVDRIGSDGQRLPEVPAGCRRTGMGSCSRAQGLR